jgi:hypothetical protein
MREDEGELEDVDMFWAEGEFGGIVVQTDVLYDVDDGEVGSEEECGEEDDQEADDGEAALDRCQVVCGSIDAVCDCSRKLGLVVDFHGIASLMKKILANGEVENSLSISVDTAYDAVF